MAVTLAKDGNVAVILIDNPPVNAIAHAVRIGLMDALYQANEDTSVRAIVIACAGDTFSAGADVREFDALPRPPALSDVANAIEMSAKPVVTAIHGAALGGGFEFALAAHARIADRDARFGLPEVKLGLVPGGGGTQRLPRLVGMSAAVDLVTSGREISAAEAQSNGALDRITGGPLLPEACAFARSLIGTRLRRTCALPTPTFDREALDKQVSEVSRRARGQDAPIAAARMTLRSAIVPFAEALREERALFNTLKDSDEAKALRYVFTAERTARKHAWLAGIDPVPIERIAVIGGGLMGAGIAAGCLDAGYAVDLIEQSEAGAASARARVAQIYDRLIKSKRADAAIKDERLSRITFSSSLHPLQRSDLVIEAVFDDLQIKQTLFGEVSTVVRSDAIIATNTSYLDPNLLARSVARPERFAGLHFFSPANVMRLAEIVRTDTASKRTLATLLAVAKKLGKVGVIAGACEGFIGNRIFTAYRRECDFMLEDGALPHEVDAALETFGYPMGPYAVNDLTGLDISWARRKRAAPTRDPTERYVAIADKLCEAGRLGQKSSRGYYLYESGGRTIDPSVTELIEKESARVGIARRNFSADEIVARVMRSIVDEGRAILAEGFAARASDIDLVLIHGYGYPAWRGGPMYRAGLR